MSVRNSDQTADAAFEPLTVSRRWQVRQVAALGSENVARQPAETQAIILPHILNNICHLKSLAEGDGQTHQRFAIFGNFPRMKAKQSRQHLPNDTGDKITIAIEILQTSEPVFRAAQLKLRHAFGHDADTLPQRVSLRLREVLRNSKNAGKVAN